MTKTSSAKPDTFFQVDYDDYIESTPLEARFDPATIQMLVIEAIPKHAAYEMSFEEYLTQRSRFSEYDSSEKKRLSFYLPLYPNTVRKRPNVPGINLPAVVVIDPAELAEVVRAMTVISDKARITAGKDGLELAAEGDTDNLRKTIAGKDGSKYPEKPVSSLFSLDYLKDTSRAMKDAESISVCVGQDHPIRFDFEIAGISASFLVAPRISEDGDA